ncbi:MAG: hypothetical protein F6K40_30025 [Okeania sp. SIO3I5]|uniref:hypothetical protein n=1 Tax=Okeania sp. SIO3I5 TaxID=2607805 RepID=UPI0013BB6BF9|nr:hypothetical protein [Okeania sp. SIO3I5]NEQ40254.1 hypothetical protein [Okeania sp. SIO3I5]
MKIATKINELQTQKLAFIQAKTQQNIDEIIRDALENYYEKVFKYYRNHLEKFSQLGFIFCIEAELDLAENCEAIFIKEMGE